MNLNDSTLLFVRSRVGRLVDTTWAALGERLCAATLNEFFLSTFRARTKRREVSRVSRKYYVGE